MKNKIKLKILEVLENTILTIDDLLFIFSLPYGTPLSKMQYLLDKRYSLRPKEKNRNKTNKDIRLRFSDFVYRLKKDGLIKCVDKNGNSFLKLTIKGKENLQKIKKNELPVYSYENIERGNDFKIVIFDIPEKERRKRVWLNSALRNLKFKMLQKSVWAGKSNLPEQFIEDLRKINIFQFIEIFTISKHGSLRQVN